MMKRAKTIEARQNQAIEQKSQLLKNKETAESLKLAPLSYRADTLVSFSDVAICYDENTVCAPVSFSVQRGDRVALCGKNGSGKSSLLKLLAGLPIGHTGTISISSGLVISYVPQDTSHLKGNLSDFARENQIDESLFKAVLRKLDFERIQFEKDMADFSGGQKKKVLIAKSLCEQAHLYVWDEPLNFIDVYSRIQIEHLIMEFSPAMIFVEHDRFFRDTVATKIVPIL
ncbi:MAG: ATP-binding cassette domain-containing protein [Acetatifactor sp.]|nr:ATP-binding cassette domain-containing protein [Acetatifactor sp.]